MPAQPDQPTNMSLGDPARRDRTLAVKAGAIVDTRTGEALDVDAMAARLEGKRLVFFGETHAQVPVQTAERQLLDALARRGRRVKVGLEMLPASVQPALDRWVRGEGSEAEMLAATHWYRHWGFHFGYYRPLFTFAREQHAPMLGLNVEREVITNVRRTGFDALAPADRAKLPARIDLANDEHRRLFSAFMGSGHGGLTPADVDSMFRAQCTWDAVMGHNAIQSLVSDNDPRVVTVVMVGFGHVAYGLGAERQAALWGREPAASVVAMAAVDDDGKPTEVRASLADFVWGMPAETDVPAFPVLGASFADAGGAAGATVISMKAGAPGDAAGLRTGDVITAIDGQPTADKEAVLLRLAGKAFGDSVAVTVKRDGKTQALTAKLTPVKPEPQPPR